MSMLWDILKGILFAIFKAILVAFATYIGLCIVGFIGICALEYWLYTKYLGDPAWWIYCIGIIVSFFIVKKCIAPVIEDLV